MADGTISFAEGLGSKALDSNEMRRNKKNNEYPIHIQSLTSNPSPNTTPPELGSDLVYPKTVPNTSLAATETPKVSDPQTNFGVQSPSTSPKPQQSDLVALRANVSMDVLGDLSPTSMTKSTHSRKLQQVFENALQKEAEEQAFVEEGLILEAEKGAPHATQVTHVQGNTYQFNRQPSEVKISNPKTLYNERGVPYSEGDPNLGYSPKSIKPRYKFSTMEHLVTSGYQSSGSKAGGNPQTLNVNFKIPSESKIGKEEFINLESDLKDGILPNPNKFHTNRHHNPIRPQGNAKNWTSLFAAQGPSKMMKLEYYPQLQQGKRAVVELDEADIDEGSWNHCLIGHFLDGKMELPLLKATARSVWKDDLLSVKEIGSRFLFEFKDEAAKLKALENGPHFFSRRFLVLQNWKRMLLPSKDQPSKIPAWIKILKLPLEFWTAECFSKIASTIGKPLHVDQATAKKLRLDYARLCVEVDAGTDLPDEVQITINGEAIIVALQYQWLPPICTVCKVFGHPTGTCTKQLGTKVSNQKDVWQVVSKGKGKRDDVSAANVTVESSSSQPAIEGSSGIPSVLPDLPYLEELQPSTISESLHTVASEIVVKDSVDKGIVVKGSMVHVLSNQDSGGLSLACEQIIQGQIEAAPGSAIPVSSDVLSDSEDEVLEDLEKVVSTNQVAGTLVHLKPPASLELGSRDSHAPHGLLGPHPLETKGVQTQAGIKHPEPPDLLGPRNKEKAAVQVPTGGLVNNNPLSKSAQKRLRQLAKAQSLCSLSTGGA